MNNSLTTIVEKPEEEEPPPSNIDELEELLKPLEYQNPRIEVRTEREHVSIYLKAGDNMLKRETLHRLFRIRPNKRRANGSQGFIESLGHPQCIEQVEEYLKSKGYYIIYK